MPPALVQQQVNSGDDDSLNPEESQVRPCVAPGIVGGVVVAGRPMDEGDLTLFSSDATEAFSKVQVKNGNAPPPYPRKQLLHDIETYVSLGMGGIVSICHDVSLALFPCFILTTKDTPRMFCSINSHFRLMRKVFWIVRLRKRY